MDGLSQHLRIVVWFSCGSASAVTAKLILARGLPRDDVAIARCVVANEHPDNDRFAADCERWFGQPILNLRSKRYADCWEVWERRRFIVSPHGALCTTEMKKFVRYDFEREWLPTHQAFGYTAEEQDRAERFRRNNPDVRLLTPLIDAGLRKADCLALIERIGIELPAMYRLGYRNNNCIGCPKGKMGYWNKIRQDFPDVFARMAALERTLDVAINKSKGQRVFLDELPRDAGRHNEPDIECSLVCEGVAPTLSEAWMG